MPLGSAVLKINNTYKHLLTSPVAFGCVGIDFGVCLIIKAVERVYRYDV